MITYDDFEAELADVSMDVSNSRHQDFSYMLRRWFDVLDNRIPAVTTEIERLGSLVSKEEFDTSIIRPGRGMIGSGQLKWPEEQDRRLSAQIGLLRLLAAEDVDPGNFAFSYYYPGTNNFNDAVRSLADQLFDPLSRELTRYLRRATQSGTVGSVDLVPAADRYVPINHNSREFDELTSALDAASSAVEESNIIDPEDKTTVKTEIDAGLNLLKSPRVRVAAIKALLAGVLGWLALTFAGTAVSMAAEAALTALGAFLGIL